MLAINNQFVVEMIEMQRRFFHVLIKPFLATYTWWQNRLVYIINLKNRWSKCQITWIMNEISKESDFILELLFENGQTKSKVLSITNKLQSSAVKIL